MKHEMKQFIIIMELIVEVLSLSQSTLSITSVPSWTGNCHIVYIGGIVVEPVDAVHHVGAILDRELSCSLSCRYCRRASRRCPSCRCHLGQRTVDGLAHRQTVVDRFFHIRRLRKLRPLFDSSSMRQLNCTCVCNVTT